MYHEFLKLLLWIFGEIGHIFRNMPWNHAFFSAWIKLVSTDHNESSCYRKQVARQWQCAIAVRLHRRNRIWKACDRWITLKVSGNDDRHMSTVIHGCSQWCNNASILHHFGDIATLLYYTLYVTARDLDRSLGWFRLFQRNIGRKSPIFTARAMIARYVLSCPSVRPSVRSLYCIETTRRIELDFLAWRLHSANSTLWYKEIWLSPKIRLRFSETLSQMSDLKKKMPPRQVDRVVNNTCWRSSLLTLFLQLCSS